MTSQTVKAAKRPAVKIKGKPKTRSVPQPKPSTAEAETQNQTPTTAETKSPGSASSPDTSHIDAIIADLKANEPAAPIGAGGASPIGMNADGFIGKDEFFGMFQFVFMAGHGATQLQSLNIEGRNTARPASDALYDICEETPSLQFFIKPGGKWMQRAAAIGMFAVPVAMGCKAELAARKQAKLAKGAPQTGGPDQQPDEDAMKDFNNATD